MTTHYLMFDDSILHNPVPAPNLRVEVRKEPNFKRPGVLEVVYGVCAEDETGELAADLERQIRAKFDSELVIAGPKAAVEHRLLDSRHAFTQYYLDSLYHIGINPLRFIPGFGYRVWGSHVVGGRDIRPIHTALLFLVEASRQLMANVDVIHSNPFRDQFCQEVVSSTFYLRYAQQQATGVRVKWYAPPGGPMVVLQTDQSMLDAKGISEYVIPFNTINPGRAIFMDEEDATILYALYPSVFTGPPVEMNLDEASKKLDSQSFPRLA